MRKLRIWLIATAITTAIALSSIPGLAQSTPTQTCAYDSSRGENPLGMRAFVTAIEQDGNTTFRFEQFPSAVGGDRPGVTIESRRELTFYDTDVAAARTLMRDNRSYYSELVDDEDSEGFAAIDAVLTCQASSTAVQPSPSPSPSPSRTPTSPSPTPTPSPVVQPSPSPSPSPSSTAANRPPIASLPNGVYRYWSGQVATSNPTLSDEELLRQGGLLFLFRKTGNQITGSFSHIDGEAICIRGTVNGNTVSGQAFPYDQSIANTGTTFTAWNGFGPLQVRRGQRAGAQSRYDSAILNLNGFNRINAGRRLPPSSCP